MRRRALAVAAAMLCAPALATTALAAIGATGGGDHAGIGSLAGSRGLRGDATPVAQAPSAPVKRDHAERKAITAGPHPQEVHAAPNRAPAPGTERPAHPAPPPSSRKVPALPKSQPVTPPTYPSDPTQPGYPTDTYPSGDTGSGSDGTTTTTTSGTSSSSDSAGTTKSAGGQGGPEAYNSYPGGG